MVGVASRLAHICSGKGWNGCLPRIAAVCAVLAVVAGAAGGGWDSAAYADGGADARKQAMAADEGGVTAQGYARRILRALADDDTNRWVRYWRARADCEAAAAREGEGAAAMERVLMGLTGMLCARLEAGLGVNPGDYLPRVGEERTVGLVGSEPGMAAGYTLFTGYWNHDVFLLDPLGRVAHAWRLGTSVIHAKLLDNGNLLAARPDRIVEFDPRGNIVWKYGPRKFHHDFLKMPNGNILMLVRARNTREQAVAAGANPEFVHESGIAHDYLLEVRPEGPSGGEIVWEWSAWDHLVQDFDPSKPNYGAIADHPERIDINFLLETISKRRPHESRDWRDWLHTNAIDYNSALDQIMLSPRHFSELWIIDHSATNEEAREHTGGNSGMGGDLLYRWGNPRAYRHGTLADQRLFWQHQPHWIPPGLPGAGNILLFNNGLEFAGDERFYSSVDEFAPPADGYRRAPSSPYPALAPEWTYAAETRADFYAPVGSGTQRLPNGNTLIVDSPAGTIFQITRDGRIVWKYVAPLNKLAHLRQGERASVQREFPTPYGDPAPLHYNMMYRAYWYPPDHPGLRALDLTPGARIEDISDIRHAARAPLAAAAAGDFGDPLVQADESGGFEIYLDESAGEDGRRLLYIKQPCGGEDEIARFFLQVIPSDVSDLPAYRQGHGFVNLDFDYYEGGEVRELEDLCVAIAGLPRYAIERIRTGEYTGAGEVWRAEVELGE